MHFFLQQTGLTAQWQHHVLRDSWPLQGRCKEKSWDLVAVSRTGWYPVDNMLPMPDLSGSLCQSICFPLSMKATWRTHHLLHICRPFFYLVTWWLNVLSRAIWTYYTSTVQSQTVCFKYSNSSVLTPNFTVSVSLAIMSVNSTLTSTTSGLCWAFLSLVRLFKVFPGFITNYCWPQISASDQERIQRRDLCE